MADEDVVSESGKAEAETGNLSPSMFAPATNIDPAAALAQWVEKAKAKEAAAPPDKPTVEIEPDPAEAKAAEPKEKAPEPKAVKDLAAKLAGKEAKAEAKADATPWDETATHALKKLGLRDAELPKLQALAAENPWLRGFVDGAQKRILKSDADFAALKAGERKPTPGAQRPLAQEQVDQPGSGKDADLFDSITKKLGVEVGDENATLLRQGFELLRAQNDELREELRGHTRGVQVEREAAEIEAMVQRSRASLREEFSGIDDEARFEAVATRLASMRPSEITQEAITEAMRNAARVEFYDDLKADAQAVASKLDTKRKNRSSETSPNGSQVHDDSPPLDEWSEMREQLRMQTAGYSREQIHRFLRSNREKRIRAQASGK